MSNCNHLVKILTEYLHINNSLPVQLEVCWKKQVDKGGNATNKNIAPIHI